MNRTNSCAAFIAALVFFSVLGCTVNITAPTPGPVDVTAPSHGEWHDVALISLDFDPPIRSGRATIPPEQITLLAALDNRGNQPESQVSVTATLRAAATDEVLARSTRLVDRLAPGEVQVVRFGGLMNVPSHPRYVLHVTAHPVPGETHVANNDRTLYITISPGN
ncbi:MAG: hypothetical protein HY329_01300 [Chloroflexi bacterium]|nr:hypothetical protein [Chloroflexota bacterium]